MDLNKLEERLRVAQATSPSIKLYLEQTEVAEIVELIKHQDAALDDRDLNLQEQVELNVRQVRTIAEMEGRIGALIAEKVAAEGRSFEMAQKYHDAVEAPAAPVVTVDTPEFRRAVELVSGPDGEFEFDGRYGAALIAHIDAHTQAAVKAEAARCNAILVDKLRHDTKEIAAKQAEIDRLMLEFCPGEMSAEQMATWEASQRRAPEAAQASAPVAATGPTIKQLAAQLDSDETWTIAEQNAFAPFLAQFPNESSQGILSLGSAWKHGIAYAQSLAALQQHAQAAHYADNGQQHEDPTGPNHPGHHDGHTCADMGQMLADFGSQRTTPEAVVARMDAKAPENRNWTEDYAGGENQYECQCSTCGSKFYGHKRRVTCKACTQGDALSQQEAVIAYGTECHRQGRASGLEEAAKAAEAVGRPVGAGDGGTYVPGTSADAARAIRALNK